MIFFFFFDKIENLFIKEQCHKYNMIFWETPETLDKKS